MIKRGFYVHYKGPIYFVNGVQKDPDNPKGDLVSYESVQGCEEWPQTGRYRPVAEFEELVEVSYIDMTNSFTVSPTVNAGLPTPLEAMKMKKDKIPRFQRVVGWDPIGRPIVQTPSGPLPFLVPINLSPS